MTALLVFVVGMMVGFALACFVLFMAIHGEDCPCSDCRGEGEGR